MVFFSIALSSCVTAKRSATESSANIKVAVENKEDWREGDSLYSETYWFEEAEEEADEPLSIIEDIPHPVPLTPSFCQEWNPEFEFRKHQCCAAMRRRNRRHPRSCAPARRSGSLCSERTPEQLEFDGGKLDALNLKNLDQQAFCTPDNGFLAHGFPILELPTNRIRIANPRRCSNFGSAGLVMLLHRLGKAIHEKFTADSAMSGVRLVIGDLSGPRGGCLGTGKSSHAGHTNGIDADVAFLQATPGVESSHVFRPHMDLAANWWLLKTVATQSPVCLQYIFLDRSHIKSLGKFVKNEFAGSADDLRIWSLLRPLFKHVRGHRNHFHFRVGTTAPKPGALRCGNHSS